MEVKILCACGTKYKFDVEPLNGKMPGPVKCPSCAADGTEAGNRLIAEAVASTVHSAERVDGPKITIPSGSPGAPNISIPGGRPVPASSALGNQPPIPVSVPQSSTTGPRPGFVAPAIPRSSKDSSSPAAPISQPVAPASHAPSGNVRVTPVAASGAQSVAAPHPPIPVAVPTSSNANPSPLVPTPASGGGRLSVAAVHAPAAAAAPTQVAVPTPAIAPARKKDEYTGPSNKRGIIGAAIGGFIGMVIWTGLIILTETEIGYVAWGVGLLTGWMARQVGRGESTEIGIAAAIAALIAILGGQFFAMRHAVNQIKETIIGGRYEAYVEDAKVAVQAKTDAQIRTYLADQSAEEGLEVTPAEISTAQVNDFKKNELPRLKRAASGQLSKSEYEREESALFDSIFTTGFLLKHSFSLFTLLWIFLGVGSAYKLASAG